MDGVFSLISWIVMSPLCVFAVPFWYILLVSQFLDEGLVTQDAEEYI